MTDQHHDEPTYTAADVERIVRERLARDRRARYARPEARTNAAAERVRQAATTTTTARAGR